MRTGPKTLRGKRHASQNARRHGLSRPLRYSKEHDEVLKNLSIEILGPDGNPKLLGLAYGVAEAVIEIRRIRQVEYGQYNSLTSRRSNTSAAGAKPPSPDFQVNKYLVRAYGRLRSKVKQFDRARLFHDHQSLQALSSVLVS